MCPLSLSCLIPGPQDYLEGKISGTDAIELIAPVGVPSVTDQRATSASATAATTSAAALAAPGSERGEDSRRGSKRGRGAGVKGEAGAGEGALGGPDSGLLEKGEGLEGGDAVDYELQRILKRERPLRSFEDLFLCAKRPDVFAGILTLMDDLDKEKKQQEVRQAQPKARGGGCITEWGLCHCVETVHLSHGPNTGFAMPCGSPPTASPPLPSASLPLRPSSLEIFLLCGTPHPHILLFPCFPSCSFQPLSRAAMASCPSCCSQRVHEGERSWQVRQRGSAQYQMQAPGGTGTCQLTPARAQLAATPHLVP